MTSLLDNSVIVCLDLALANTGVAVLRVNKNAKDELLVVNTIHTDKSKKAKVSDDEWRRTTELAAQLAKIVKEHDPVHVFIECPTGGSKSASAARSMAVARGAACACLHGLGKAATLISPFEAKAAATGNKTAEKSEVKEAVKKEFPDFQGWVLGKRGQVVEGLNEHVYDALSVYMAAKNTEIYSNLKGVTYAKSNTAAKARTGKRKHNIYPTPER
jgi:Holliday junction resolvasome RuvABC endonuclease subunit